MGTSSRRRARGLEGEAAVELAREQALGIRAGLDERADERRDQRPRPLVDGGRVGAQLAATTGATAVSPGATATVTGRS